MLSSGSAPDASGVWSALGRDRPTLLTGVLLLAVAAVAWIAVVLDTNEMQRMRAAGGDTSMAMPAAQPGTGVATARDTPAAIMLMIEPQASIAMPGGSRPGMLGDPLRYVVSWGVMMAAMMLPSAAPMIALYGAVRRHFGRTGQRGIPTALFALLYVLLWLVTGVPIYIASVAVGAAADASPTVGALLPYALAVVLAAAGVYQFTPLKRACLRVCRSPLGYLMGQWRGGYRGTLRLAWNHASYCIGCCWALMVVLVAAGAMGLQWVLLIAAVVFVEKLLPGAEWTARGVGGALVALGLLVAVQPGLAALLRSQGM
jgi:predicted metal-binding membrane protein